MAINQNGFLRGQVGNLVNRKVGNINVIQTKSGRPVKQSQATKDCARDFGVASKAAHNIRFSFTEIHQNLYDSQMINRLNKQVYRALRSNPDQRSGCMSMDHAILKRLIGFQFNEKNHLEDYLYLDPEIHLNQDKQMTIQIPEFDILKTVRMTKTCHKIIMHFQIKSFNFAQQTSEVIKNIEMEIDVKYDDTIIQAKTWTVDCSGSKNNIMLVGFNIHYIIKSGVKEYLLNDKDFNTAAIIGAFTI